MPAILSKKDVLDGRAQILNYKRLPNVWYYREVIPGEKRYRTQKIQGAESEAEAAAQALDIYGEFRKATPPQTTLSKVNNFNKKDYK